MQLLDYMEAKKLLDKYGIGSVESRYVSTSAEAVSFSYGNPIVLKVISDKALHKAKAGLVKPGLATKAEITGAFRELTSKAVKLKPYKIIAQKMAHSGVEIIVGGRADPQFGKFILIGLGGIYVEAFKDFALRLCPITKADSMEMLGQLRSKDIITHNGKMAGTLSAILMKVSRLLIENDGISELDLNPIIVSETGYTAVDIRILK